MENNINVLLMDTYICNKCLKIIWNGTYENQNSIRERKRDVIGRVA